MLKFYLNEDFKFSKPPEIPPLLIQFSTEDVEIHIPFADVDQLGHGRSLIINIIRPDGFKTNEMFGEFTGEDPDNPGTYIWKSKIVPFHTSVIPGTSSTGSLIVGFMLKEFNGQENLIDVLSSPITKITIQRSIEPNEDFLDFNAAEDLDRRLNTLEVGALDHSVITLFSRSKPDQHPIEAISGLKPKVEVHISEEEPIEQIDTWFDVSAIDDEVAPATRWEKLASTPIIFIGQVINCNSFSESEPIKFVVVGNLAGEIYRQEFHSDEYGYIMGEAVIYISANYASIASVSFVLEPISGQNAFSVASFENTGNLNISDFTALSIEVYR